jgi:hypothetical protein
VRASAVLLLAAVTACTSLTGAADLTVVGTDTAPPDRNPTGGDGGATPIPTGPSDPGAPRPNTFDFTDVTNADLATSYTASVVVGGFDAPIGASVSGGDAQIMKPGLAWANAITLFAGETLQIRMTSSPTPATALTATLKVGGLSVDWVVKTAPSCATQTVTWGANDKSQCSAATAAPILPGGSASLSDTTAPITGKVGVTCVKGTLTQSPGATCGPAQSFDLDDDTACMSGYCSATVVGTCKPDTALADAYCTVKGYAAQTSFAVETPVDQASQCAANGSRCFVSTDPNCDKVFSTITCRY